MKKKNHIDPSVIVLLAADIEKGEDGVWYTSQYDHSGITCGQWRVLATFELFKQLGKPPIIVSGGYSSRRKEECPSIAEVASQELMELGVPRELIAKEESSYNTYSQLKEVLSLCVSNEFDRVTFVTSVWAMNRAYSLYSNLISSIGDNIEIKFCDAETVLINAEPTKWKQEIESALSSKAVKERIKKEQRGIEDIKNGKYKLN